MFQFDLGQIGTLTPSPCSKRCQRGRMFYNVYFCRWFAKTFEHTMHREQVIAVEFLR
ncbi:MAG: hypothetical protein FWE41_07590 [Coriobacteriia bacterium]|nr:hypothetical protein [Coriobacteriia bacterium]